MQRNDERQGRAATAAGESAARRGLSEPEFFELRARLERMGADELAVFRADPANRALLARYDAHARRIAAPYLLALSGLLLFSLATGAWLAS